MHQIHVKTMGFVGGVVWTLRANAGMVFKERPVQVSVVLPLHARFSYKQFTKIIDILSYWMTLMKFTT